MSYYFHYHSQKKESLPHEERTMIEILFNSVSDSRHSNSWTLRTTVAKLFSSKDTVKLSKILYEIADFFALRKNIHHYIIHRCSQLAISLDSHNVDAWVLLAKFFLFFLGDPNRARSTISNALEQNPSDPYLLKYAIFIEDKMERYSNAKPFCQQILEINYSVDYNFSFLSEMMKVHLKNGRIDIVRLMMPNLAKRITHFHLYELWVVIEEKYGDIQKALSLAKYSFKRFNKKNNFAFYLLRIYDQIYHNTHPSIGLQKMYHLSRSIQSNLNSHEKWFFNLELSFIEARYRRHISILRTRYVGLVKSCPQNVWLHNVWLTGAKNEVRTNPSRIIEARKLIQRSLAEICNSRIKTDIYIQWARLEEYARNNTEARSVYQKAKGDCPDQWRIFFEEILFECRNLDLRKALRLIKRVIVNHDSCGRLWETSAQLHTHFYGVEKGWEICQKALLASPLSGEIWTECGRLFMNPRFSRFDLNFAKLFLNFARHLTPQYGDIYIDLIRLDLMQTGGEYISDIKHDAFVAEPSYGCLWEYCKKNVYLSSHQILDHAIAGILDDPMFRLCCIRSYNQSLSKIMDDYERWHILFGCFEKKIELGRHTI